MKLIGFAGPAGSGKSEAAEFLRHHFGFRKYAFADPLKRMVAALFDITPEEFERKCQDRTFKESPIGGLNKSPRQLMQTLGTEWGRDQVHPDVWVSIAQLHIYGHYWTDDAAPGVAIHDVRFNNEANWIRMNDGLIVHLVRDGIEPVAEHTSEKGIDVWASDATVYNNGQLMDLHTKLFHLVNDMEDAA